MTRTFHSVGQGAFYTEVYDGFNVVYDCGSSTGHNLVTNEIKKEFHEKEKIDLLFISHFHEDHINGLDFLLDYCDVKYIILPLQYEEDKVYTLMDNYYHLYKDNEMILDPEKFVGERAKLVFVQPTEPDKVSNATDNIINIKDYNYILIKIFLQSKPPRPKPKGLQFIVILL